MEFQRIGAQAVIETDRIDDRTAPQVGTTIVVHLSTSVMLLDGINDVTNMMTIYVDIERSRRQ